MIFSYLLMSRPSLFLQSTNLKLAPSISLLPIMDVKCPLLLIGYKGGRKPDAQRRVAPSLSNSNTLFSMCVRTPAASFGVCPQRPATTQSAVQIPAAPQSAIAIVLY